MTGVVLKRINIRIYQVGTPQQLDLCRSIRDRSKRRRQRLNDGSRRRDAVKAQAGVALAETPIVQRRPYRMNLCLRALLVRTFHSFADTSTHIAVNQAGKCHMLYCSVIGSKDGGTLRHVPYSALGINSSTTLTFGH